LLNKENFLPSKYANELKGLFIDGGLPMYYIEDATYQLGMDEDLSISNSNKENTGSLTHMFYGNGEQSTWWNFVKPISYFVDFDYKRIMRCRGQILTPRPYVEKEYEYNTPHVDHFMDEDFMSLIYYINNSDGDTFLFKENHRDGHANFVTVKDRVSHKENSAIIFDGKQYHASSNPTHNNYRATISMTFEL
jgi:hypothetical protein